MNLPAARNAPSSAVGRRYVDDLLADACGEGDSLRAMALIEEGAHPGLGRSNNKTALVRACESDKPLLARLLLEAGADPNAADAQGKTALATCCAKDRAACAKILIAGGAAMDGAPGPGGELPAQSNLHLCAREGSVGCMEALLAAGCPPDGRVKRGITPLMAAGIQDRPGVVSALLRAGAAIDAVDADGLSALAHACRRGSKEFVARLLMEPAAREDAARMLARPHEGPWRRSAMDEGSEACLALARLAAPAAPAERAPEGSKAEAPELARA